MAGLIRKTKRSRKISFASIGLFARTSPQSDVLPSDPNAPCREHGELTEALPAHPDSECECSAVQQAPDAVVDQVASPSTLRRRAPRRPLTASVGPVGCAVAEVDQHVVTTPLQGPPEGGQLVEPGRDPERRPSITQASRVLPSPGSGWA